MSNWYEQAYVYDIGQAVFVPFVRPLYPPSHPDGPVPDGPDVEAVKRICSKLGRWPWPGSGSPPAPQFDQAFSNAFALGQSGGNVGTSGLAGVQRQAKVAKASGAYGERTHDILIYSRIPQGRDNAGQYACDDKAVALFQQAAKMFPKDKPPAKNGGSAREKCRDHQEARVGFTENPSNSNKDKRSNGISTSQIRCLGWDGEPWCGCWCHYSLTAAGVTGMGSWMASVAAIEDRARAGNTPFRGWTTDRSRIKMGDLVVIGGYGVHVEQVRGAALSDGGVPTWGGNTSPGTSGSQSNGGGAFRRVRYPGEVRGFALVRFPGE